MTRRQLLFTLAAAVPAGARSASARETPPADETSSGASGWTRSEPHMGCLWTLKLPGLPQEKADEAGAAVFTEIKRLNQIFSDYEPSSELNRLCARAGSPTTVEVSPELFTILQQSRRISENSAGLFDVTLAPCIRLWRRSRRQTELPSRENLAKAKALTGWQKMELDETRRTVRLAQAGMQLDLGGIAKGWTQDACLKLLRDRWQITSVLLDAAGEVAVGTPPPGRQHWTLALQPMRDGAKPGRIAVRETNVATSGDHYQFVEIAGTRYSHIIDPRTGLGSTISRQGTIIAPVGALADPLAKILCLTTPEESLPIVKKHWPEVKALVTESTAPGSPLKTHQTPDFPPVEN